MGSGGRNRVIRARRNEPRPPNLCNTEQLLHAFLYEHCVYETYFYTHHRSGSCIILYIPHTGPSVIRHGPRTMLFITGIVRGHIIETKYAAHLSHGYPTVLYYIISRENVLVYYYIVYGARRVFSEHFYPASNIAVVGPGIKYK